MKSIYQPVILLVMMTIVLGILYPLCITAFGQLLWHNKSNGSLIKEGNMIIGSELIAQKFTTPKYFWARPSASTWATIPSTASNLGPTSADLALSIKERRALLANIHGMPTKNIPMDLVTTSASGLDPHISVEAAYMQLNRIVMARGLNENAKKKVLDLIEKHAGGAIFASAGKKNVNVVLLNVDLDRCCRHD
jgi:K+-transporting ATPase ATPase C chain